MITNQETYKEIKQDMRNIKGTWAFKEYVFNGEIYETKRFNTWFQIFRHKENKTVIPFPMCETQKEVIEVLKKYDKEVK